MKKFLIAIFILVLVISISGCINSTDTKSNNSNVTTKVFENQWIKFEYPGNLYIVDQSGNNFIDVLIIKESAFKNDTIGEIQNSVNDKNMMISVNKEQNSTFETIAGKEGLYYNDSSETSAYIFLEGDKGLWIDFYDRSYYPAFQMIKKSIIIKKIPS